LQISPFRLLLIPCLFICFSGCFNTERTSPGEGLPSSGFSIKGISLVAPVKRIDATALQPITNIKANSIAVMPYAFCSPENPVIQYNHKGQWWGESDEGVIGTIQLAHQRNLSVMLKPHLWIGHGVYTGKFKLNTENEWASWEESYRHYILHYATIADSMKVELFCFATELGAAIKERPQFWGSLIDEIKQYYHGKLTYAANWDDYKNFPFWTKLDYIGVDAYFPLSNDKTPSTNTLTKGWRKYSHELQKFSEVNTRRVLFSEYGYRNVDYAGAEPWKESDESKNDEAQANALEAFYQSFADKRWFAGGYLWKWYVEEGHHRHSDIDYTPQNKPAAKVIENWYRN
jgi:hypothetical protein